jgi:dienelactone hydrolase
MHRVIASLLLLVISPSIHADEHGTVTFEPLGDQKTIPRRYRLGAHKFRYQMSLLKEMPISKVKVYSLRFPSPVESSDPENNIVYAEYYRPNKPGPFPCVVVLDITGGDQSLSRVIARHLAQNGIGGLFVQMAYYGPRRPPGSNRRLLSYDIGRTYAAIRQTVLDLHRAAAWMASRQEIDKDNLGIMGTSLGSFMAALTAEMEPRYRKVAVLLGGGGFVDAYYNNPKARPFVNVFETWGGSKELATLLFAPIDPITCAGNLTDRKLLIVAAKNDEIVPPRMADNLWNATGRQRIIWLNAGHYSAILFLVSGLDQVVEHFK